MTMPDGPDDRYFAARRHTEDGGYEVTAIVFDPADAQQTWYGHVTRHGVLIGTYFCADRVRQRDWHIVTSEGVHIVLDSPDIHPIGENIAVMVLTGLRDGSDAEIDRWADEMTRRIADESPH
ncbi:hypothetical protein V5P93_002348 [Actinokineospora auranticolor]|uniref:Uncharacterized protein n=1 Tax=Actinokineospora auranticolor TaxID=155976 RepID=A0A2S6GDS3_9PSEU|nr:hypothetical protein [Actinokineospora auranticolor]PPK63379.1 hypothetical protein CLV40_12992 [Actinokineospora auranticolor]